ncbi:radical SAM protein [archaeon]|jgi:radical SAM superfamily enzyme with C-terminal helix-hairpin-helix motif|nr:radical SAM protein [archaeon]MBT6868439.1 radical SAM protein [archaeon]MBT7193538.1 radical SAM protein [archaeon]MBT7381267.1 radical SAM protein [archaeon]MBT7508439.1 radical SAM protein [archaeon]
MRFTIIDCYTDEPSGLGVLPTLGTYPRYLAGAVLESGNEFYYLTIDDIRATVLEYEGKKTVLQIKEKEKEIKTNVKIRNLTPNFGDITKILDSSDVIIIIAGVHTPGKYLSAYPGTTKEISTLLKKLRCKTFKVLTGPAAHTGSGLWGGKKARSVDQDVDQFDLVVKDLEYKFDELIKNNFTEDINFDIINNNLNKKENQNYKTYDKISRKAVLGASIVEHLPLNPKFVTVEIETMRGCARKVPCSFCTEKLKSNCVERRPAKDIIEEIKALSKVGLNNFRIGKQTCIYSYGDEKKLEQLFKEISKYANILHIDNVNPTFVNEEKTKTLVKYCTSGNVAAMGVESFDKKVIKSNMLNTSPELTFKKIKLINQYGAERGSCGMPKFIPGINLIFGLINESKNSHKENLFWLNKIIDEGLLLRRINVREVVIFPETQLDKEAGDKFLKKNRKHYWKWRNDIRQNIDHVMLKKIVPEGTILKNLRTEIYDGNTTFARQVGTYPLVVGIKGRIQLDEFVNVKIVGHMLRSLVGEIVSK